MLQLDPPEDDGLFMPAVGPWSADKHHFLRRYIDAFTTSMREKKWKGLHYIDLFASAGIERLRGDGLDWGSPLIAAQARFKFAQIHCCEIRQKAFDALQARLRRYPQPAPPQLIRGDANRHIDEIVQALPIGSLSLAFLDPYGLHLNLETLKRLALRRTDWIIFFPDHLDALRNWRNVYAGKPDSNLNQVLGTPDWHEAFMSSPRDSWPAILRNIYEEQIRNLGYEFVDYERITFRGGKPLYLLIFCCQHERGAEIWRNVTRKKASGQKTFDF
ncbi:MAG: three-Cys-motif partner protein TcmP [Phycisphaerales bacterium]|nr:three-Cys-motif partner protein TcmP [Phycisphaerales bacterium]MCI0631813.1 three-Cys-motif partner protein TcmP [Phycisphaerales bacterium]MCI0675810.1 three-Cys-motif partner protein TcmP [Phycisphaerales bacterium]